MTALLRKFLPVVSTVPKEENDDGDYSLEYSIALEYKGPIFSGDIPQALPVNIDEIPTAAVFPAESLLLDRSLPIIQPIRKRDFNQKLFKELGISKEVFYSAHSIEPSVGNAGYGTRALGNGNDTSLKSAGELDSSRGSDHEDERVSKSSDSVEGETNIIAEPKLPDDFAEANMQMQSADSAPPRPSSNNLSQMEEDSDNEMPRHAKKPSAVTFRDPDSADIFDEESVFNEVDSFPVKQRAENNGKKGSCYRCFKGSRFTEKEVCIVCDAKYCQKCVLRAMGSMPEGRKCVTCIGFRIDEMKRSNLGKCSRMLKWLLPESEMKQIMSSEVLCPANQIPPNLVYVNGEALDDKELLWLRGCPNPPKKLRPGYYWYDKVAGFWGKEGQKPCQIISAQLNVGGYIKRDASNGNTDVLINNREITKEEVWMLKSAGIPCEGKPHFWVSADGSYQEEGQKNAKGRIWDKTKTKLVCAILSLPIPPDNAKSGEETTKDSRGQNDLHHKLLLVGFDKSGTSTIFKQAKILYGVPFSEDERQNIKLMIQSNLYCYLGILLEGRERFEEETLKGKGKSPLIDQPSSSGCKQFERGSSREKGKGVTIDGCRSSEKMYPKETKLTYSMGSKLKAFSDWLLKVIASGNLEAIVPSASHEYSPLIEELWKDETIQATYNRRNELEKLPRVATYFLERAVEISKEEYEPSDMDILYAEGITSSNGLASMEFSFPTPAKSDGYIDSIDQRYSKMRYQLIRVHPRSLGENCKWLEMFEDVNIVLFCVSLTDYDESYEDNKGLLINKMMASKQLFESIVTHPTFYKKDFLLIMNKFDLLEEKIEQSPLTQCEWFCDFHPVISHNHNNGTYVNPAPSLAQRAFHYMAAKFKRLFHSLTERKLYVSLVTGLEQDSVDESLKYAREIMSWDEEDITIINEESSASVETSTS
ncbi:extra-large guanine nucleotide-binding protein 1-like isoform X1 [Syzygium oleosum]|uniref:extra-large guanine nucleotide-binding protein 1-like isoform X1 n=1 Tax=Syzygium oleosum TaxID=219896 RepID=UPI0024BAAE0C|nr:extra-large guanine nucleotide-binding protein 1-like isoform X1 [Syzygium oleosum]XP_056160758.1 extra-large guanine nucleotide-binding protein 1-like isoform X1 [Syzygium oleosum]